MRPKRRPECTQTVFCSTSHTQSQEEEVYSPQLPIIGSHTQTLSWKADNNLVTIIPFCTTDEPSARNVSAVDLETCQGEDSKMLAVSKHNAFKDSRIRDARMEKAAMLAIRERDGLRTKRLQEMAPDADWAPPRSIIQPIII